MDPLTLDVYAGPRAAEFKLYEDDGMSLDYRNGAYAWTPLRFASERAGDYTLTIGPAQGKFQGQVAKTPLRGACSRPVQTRQREL